MPFPPSPHADAISPSRQRRQAHALALLAAVSLIGGSAVLNLIDDPRPLDVQLSGAFSRASDTLTDWQDQLSHGLQVSMLAVADASELPAPEGPVAARAATASAPAAGPAVQ